MAKTKFYLLNKINRYPETPQKSNTNQKQKQKCLLCVQTDYMVKRIYVLPCNQNSSKMFSQISSVNLNPRLPACGQLTTQRMSSSFTQTSSTLLGQRNVCSRAEKMGVFYSKMFKKIPKFHAFECTNFEKFDSGDVCENVEADLGVFSFENCVQDPRTIGHKIENK